MFAGVGLLVCVSGKGMWSYAEALLLAGCCGAGCRRLLRLLQKSCKNHYFFYSYRFLAGYTQNNDGSGKPKENLG